MNKQRQLRQVILWKDVFGNVTPHLDVCVNPECDIIFRKDFVRKDLDHALLLH